MKDWIAASEVRRANRHTAFTKRRTGQGCPQCSRICASEFALYGATCGLMPSQATETVQMQCRGWNSTAAAAAI